jgi:hypothetical protein
MQEAGAFHEEIYICRDSPDFRCSELRNTTSDTVYAAKIKVSIKSRANFRHFATFLIGIASVLPRRNCSGFTRRISDEQL